MVVLVAVVVMMVMVVVVMMAVVMIVVVMVVVVMVMNIIPKYSFSFSFPSNDQMGSKDSQKKGDNAVN